MGRSDGSYPPQAKVLKPRFQTDSISFRAPLLSSIYACFQRGFALVVLSILFAVSGGLSGGGKW